MLSQNYFYWEMVKKYIVAFHHLFEDVHVIRLDKDGNIRKDVTVPCSYVGKQKMFYLLQRKDEIGDQIRTVLPRMSFLITGLQPDTARKEAATNTIPISYNFGGAEDTESFMYNPVPYNFSIQFSIWAEYQDDMMQIIEQVGTFFRPDHTFFVEEIDELDIRRNISIVLNNMNLDISNEFADEEDRIITADIDFTLKGYLYPPIKDESIIKIINVRFTDYNDRCLDLANINHTFDEICAVNKEAAGAMAAAAEIQFNTVGDVDGVFRFQSNADIGTVIESGDINVQIGGIQDLTTFTVNDPDVIFTINPDDIIFTNMPSNKDYGWIYYDYGPDAFKYFEIQWEANITAASGGGASGLGLVYLTNNIATLPDLVGLNDGFGCVYHFGARHTTYVEALTIPSSTLVRDFGQGSLTGWGAQGPNYFTMKYTSADLSVRQYSDPARTIQVGAGARIPGPGLSFRYIMVAVQRESGDTDVVSGYVKDVNIVKFDGATP